MNKSIKKEPKKNELLKHACGQAVPALLAASALLSAAPVLAQNNSVDAADQAAAAPAPNAALGEVTVSASRIELQGYSQPTPVVVVGLPEITTESRADLGDLIRELPSVQGASLNTQQNNITNGTEGLDDISLRNLGLLNTLVLFDGQRVVNSNISGGVDLSTIPSALVERIDVVTGGASAAWGSDAVAGVVNLIINHNFNGVQVNLEDSNNWEAQHLQEKVDIALGTAFDGDRGHVELGASWLNAPNAFFSQEEQGFAYQRLMPNPACPLGYLAVNLTNPTGCGAGVPAWVHASNVGLYQETPGGIITGTYNAAGKLSNAQPGSAPSYANPNGVSGGAIAGGPLVNTYFEGPNATPYIFNPGTTSSGAWTSGGTQNTQEGDYELDAFPLTQENLMFLGSFKLTDAVTASVQYDYGFSHWESDSYSDDHYASVKILSGNPYIPASVQSLMTADNISALQMGTSQVNPTTGNTGGLGGLVNTIGIPVGIGDRELNRFVFSLDGSIGPDWTWKAYAQHSEVYYHEFLINNVSEPAFTNAVNAVTVGSYNANYTAAKYPNPLNLTPGATTCLSNLLPVGAAGETTNCAPLNIFGTGPGIASQQAIDYVNGDARAGLDEHQQTLTQNAAELSVVGKLPFGLPAGQVALAAGIDYRREKGVDISTYQAAVLKEFSLGDFPNFWGQYSTKEGFLELNVPVLKDLVVKDLGINLAGRVTDYSTSGTVKTYKFGLTSQVTDWVRFRGSYSYDILAPQLSQLFNQGTPVLGSAVDPRNLISVSEFGTSEGNPNLKPQVSETKSMGLVFTPVQGLTASFDWYFISIKSLIAAISATFIEKECMLGTQSGNAAELAYCGPAYGLVFGGPIGPKGYPELSAVLGVPINANSETTDGWEANIDYRVPSPWTSGALGFHADVTEISALNTINAQSGQTDSVNSSAVGGIGSSGPIRYRAKAALSYTQGPWLGTLQMRMVGDHYLNTLWNASGVSYQTGQQIIDDNYVPWYFYFDLRASYKFDNGIQLYANIDNVLDKLIPPEAVTGTSVGGTSLFESDLSNTNYDGYGRVWRVGVRAKF